MYYIIMNRVESMNANNGPKPISQWMDTPKKAQRHIRTHECELPKGTQQLIVSVMQHDTCVLVHASSVLKASSRKQIQFRFIIHDP